MTKADVAVIHPDSPWAMFETNKDLEQGGIRIDYGKYYFQVARAGGENTRYRDMLRQRLAPHNRAINTGTMDETLAQNIIRDVFAETVILDWGSLAHGEGKMIARDGSALEFSAENVKMILKQLPDLAADLQQQAGSAALYRAVLAEFDAKN